MTNISDKSMINLKYISRAMYLFFIAFVAIITYYIILNAEWILGDDKQTMLTTGSGIPMPMFTELIGGGISNGRFCPLAHQELNVLTLIPYGYTPLAHYLFNAFFFIILSVFSVVLLRDIQKFYYDKDSVILPILNYIFLFVGCTFLTTYLDVIYGRFVPVLYLFIFYLMLLNIKTGKIKYLVYSVPIVLWITYSGETLFSSFFVIGSSLLLFNYRNNTKALNYYAIFLVCDAILYLLLYVVFVLPNSTSTYTSVPNDHFFRDLLLWTPHAALILIMSLIRLYYIIIKKDTSRIYIDSILFGGAVLALANIVLKLSTAYYYINVMLFLMPSFLYWSYHFYMKNKRMLCLLGIVMLILFIRPIHLFPYLIVNNQHRRTTEMASIRQVEPFVVEDRNRVIFLTGAVPEGSYERNVRIFVKRVLKETYEFETKRDILVKELNDITNGEYPHLFLTKQDAKYLEKVQEDYLKQCYDSIQSFGDLNVIFYKKR